jgi:hypothetical protein
MGSIEQMGLIVLKLNQQMVTGGQGCRECFWACMAPRVNRRPVRPRAAIMSWAAVQLNVG